MAKLRFDGELGLSMFIAEVCKTPLSKYAWLDPIVARSAQTVEPEYMFPPLFEHTEQEKAETENKRADTVQKMIGSAVWDEDGAIGYMKAGIVPDEGTFSK